MNPEDLILGLLQEFQPISAYVAQLCYKVSYYLLVVLPPAFASALVVYHHATELTLMFAGLLPHDGSAGGGGAAGHGCCREAKKDDTWESGERESIQQCEEIKDTYGSGIDRR